MSRVVPVGNGGVTYADVAYSFIAGLFTSCHATAALDQLRVKLAAKGHLGGDRSWHLNASSLASLFNFGEILPFFKDSCGPCFQKDMSFFPARFSLSYSSCQSFTRGEWKSCIKVFLNSFVGKPWVLKFGWISNAWYLICLRELRCASSLDSAPFSLVWPCNAFLDSLECGGRRGAPQGQIVHSVAWQQTDTWGVF